MLRRRLFKAYVSFLKKNELESIRLRQVFRLKYGVEIGLYSYGCFDPARISPNTRIGRYCSVAPTAWIFGRNHGVSFVSMHPYLYNASLGFPQMEPIPYRACEVGDGAWIGHGAVILPSVVRVGRGAVVAAGSIVVRDVPDYAVVAGNPARVVKMRFEEEVIQKIEDSRWWEMSKEDFAEYCRENRDFIFRPTESSTESV